MGAIGFYLFFTLNWIVTFLPLRILFFFSDLLYIFLYYFPSYRRNIVAENLRNSFPEKSDAELNRIAKRFYRHFADLFIETLKLTHLTNNELKKRVVVTNPELVENLFNSGHDVIAVYSHYNNWEWVGVAFPLYTRYKTIGVYKPVQNRYFNRFINRLRSRNDAGLAPMDKIARRIVENKSKNIRSFYGFISDQTPAKVLIRYYTDFLNQQTPVFLGIERIAAKYDMSVVFINVQKIKRGFYTLTVELLYETTRGLPEYEVTKKHVKRLEELIREKPEYWIWTHRRWKYKKPAQND